MMGQSFSGASRGRVASGQKQLLAATGYQSLLAAASSLGLILSSGAAWAASDDPPPGGQDATSTAQTRTAPDQANPTSDIIVTANRRAESAQKVPTSIDVVSSQELISRNVTNVFGLQYIAPSLQVTPQFGSSQPAYQIRGVGFNDYASNNTPAVGIYIDEVAYPIPFATNGAMFDVQRVEVLRGPQGTLYGRNTTGGAINYIMAKPTSEMSAAASLQYSRFDAIEGNAYISGPLSDTVRFRIAGNVQSGGAWQHNRVTDESLGDARRVAARALLDVDATSNLKLEFNFHISRDRSDAAGTYLLRPMTALNSKYPTIYPIYPADTDPTATGWGTTPQFASEIGIKPTTKPFAHFDTVGGSLRADLDLGFATLTDLASYDHAKREEYINFDGTEYSTGDVYFNTRANVFANELRLTSADGGPWHWVGGIYYSNQTLSDRYATGYYQLNGFDRNVTYRQLVNTVSGFGQVTYDLTSKLSVTGGFRLEYEKRELKDFGAYYVVNGAVTNPTNFVPYRSTSFVQPSGKVSVQYRPGENDMMYASFSRGIKSGGFTAYNSAVAETSTNPFKPETLLAYEIGNKLTIPRYGLRFNLSAFYYDYRNQQVQAAVVNPLTGLVGSIVNAPRSHLYGGEMEIAWEPVRGLQISETLALAQGKFDRFSTIGSAVKGTDGLYVGVLTNRAGMTEFAPKFTTSGSISYTAELGDYRLKPSVSYASRSAYHSIFGSAYDVRGYTLVDASLTLSRADDGWSIMLYGQNIFDQRYDVTRNFFVAGNDIALAGKPATYGVRLAVKY